MDSKVLCVKDRLWSKEEGKSKPVLFTFRLTEDGWRKERENKNDEERERKRLRGRVTVLEKMKIDMINVTLIGRLITE